MKKIMLVIATACLMGSMAFAQTEQTNTCANGKKAPKKMDATTMTTRMDKEITGAVTGLTDAQKTKIHDLSANLATEMEKNHQEAQTTQDQTKSDMKAMHSQMKQTRDNYDAQLKTVLTDAQYQQYQAYQKGRKDAMKGHKGPGQGKGNGQKPTEEK